MPSSKLPVVNSLWIGPELGAIHVRCLESFPEVGHRLRLHVYETPVDVPAGVELVDASTVLPASEIIFHRDTGSPSLFSNRFRYELMAKGAGVWADCDVLCVRPIPDQPYVLGFEKDGASINGAVLRMPADSPMLGDLLATYRRGWIPPWLPEAEQAACRRLMARDPLFGPADLPWGSFGPHAITFYAARHDLIRLAEPQEVYYPALHDLLFAPDFPLATRITRRTRTLHLVNSMLSRVAPGTPISRRSLLGAILARNWRDMLAEAWGDATPSASDTVIS